MKLTARPLNADAFAPYGEVIETTGSKPLVINEGFTERFHDLARVDVAAEGGHPLISIFRSRPRPTPLTITTMERHPLGSQAFVPLSSAPFLVLVAPADRPAPTADDLELFVSSGEQGVNYRRNVWHHYCLALETESDFLVVDRGGPGNNLEEFRLPDDEEVVIDRAASRHV